jgi:hypothetical protein
MKSEKWGVPAKDTTVSRYADVYRVYEQVIADMNAGSNRILGRYAPANVTGVKLILDEVERRLNYSYNHQHIYRIIRTVQQHHAAFFGNISM